MVDWQAELKAAEQAVAAMTGPAADKHLEATAAWRPALQQPGTLGQQLTILNLFVHLPAELRRRDREAAWGACRRHVLGHAQPAAEQVRGRAKRDEMLESAIEMGW